MTYTVKEKKSLAKVKDMRYLQMNGLDIYIKDMVGFVFSDIRYARIILVPTPHD